MLRRHFLRSVATGIIGVLPSQPDFTLRIQPVTVELTPKQHIKTIGYNGTAPGPLLRVAEGKTISIDIFNERDL